MLSPRLWLPFLALGALCATSRDATAQHKLVPQQSRSLPDGSRQLLQEAPVLTLIGCPAAWHTPLSELVRTELLSLARERRGLPDPQIRLLRVRCLTENLSAEHQLGFGADEWTGWQLVPLETTTTEVRLRTLALSIAEAADVLWSRANTASTEATDEPTPSPDTVGTQLGRHSDHAIWTLNGSFGGRLISERFMPGASLAVGTSIAPRWWARLGAGYHFDSLNRSSAQLTLGLVELDLVLQGPLLDSDGVRLSPEVFVAVGLAHAEAEPDPSSEAVTTIRGASSRGVWSGVGMRLPLTVRLGQSVWTGLEPELGYILVPASVDGEANTPVGKRVEPLHELDGLILGLKLVAQATF